MLPVMPTVHLKMNVAVIALPNPKSTDVAHHNQNSIHIDVAHHNQSNIHIDVAHHNTHVEVTYHNAHVEVAHHNTHVKVASTSLTSSTSGFSPFVLSRTRIYKISLSHISIKLTFALTTV